MPRTRLLGALLAFLALAPASAADKPAERATNDRQIIDALTSVHDRGAALFNAGDAAGCFRLFQGSLTTVRIVLPKELHETVDRGLADADREANISRRAMLLHEVIEAVRVRLHPTAGTAPTLLGPPRKLSSDGEPGKAPELAAKPVLAEPVKRPVRVEEPPAFPPGRIEIPTPMDEMPPAKPSIPAKPVSNPPPPVTAPMDEPGPIIIPVPDKR